MTQARYAELIGLTPDTVRGMVDRGQLPTVKRGRHRFINLEAVRAENLSQVNS